MNSGMINYKKEIMKPIKKPFKLSVFGFFKLETENMTIKEILLILAMVMVFVVTIIFLLKVYVLPALAVSGIVNRIGLLIQLFKTRAP